MSRQMYLCSLLLIALLAACGGGDGPTSDSTGTVVRPLADILVGEPIFTDQQPHSMTVELDTTVPVVCAAAYGVTTAYGQLATDTDMTGTGHQNHHPVLMGLAPDTEYHVRLQGIASDGALYRSQDYSFRTPPAEVTDGQKPSGENLALLSNGARVVGVSSNYGGGDNDSNFGSNNAVDGKQDTEWSTDGDGDEAWIEIELAGEVHVTSIGFHTRTMVSSAQIRVFRVVTDRGETYGPFDVEDATRSYYFTTDFTARTLRFEAVESSGGNTGAVEIEVYSEPDDDTGDM